jgi:serine/threonine-protein kinase
VVVALDSTIGEVGFAWPEPLPNGKGLIFRSRRAGETTQNYVIKALDLETRTQKVLVQGVVARYAPTGNLIYVTADGVLLSAPFDEDRLELTGAATPLVEGLGVAGFGAVDLTLSRSGDLMYVSTKSQGGERPSWVRRDGTSELVDPEWQIGVETIIDMALSPDGKRLALTIGTGGRFVSRGGGRAGNPSDIWVKELDTGPMSKLTFEGINSSPAWTPDGSAIVYVSVPTNDPNVVGQLYRIRADGTGSPEPLLTEPRGVDGVHLSPQDDWAVLTASVNKTGAGDILAFRPGIDTAMVPLLSSPTGEFQPRLSADGRWLAYVSNESGRPEVYVRPFPAVTQGKWQISLNGGFWPRWAHNGSELFYLEFNNDLTATEIRTAPTFSVGRRQVLHNGGAIPVFEVAPDDQRFLRLASQTGADSVSTQLVLVQNFLSELKAKVPR